MSDLKTRIVATITSTGAVGDDSYEVSDEGKLRVVTEQCSAGNVLVVRGRIKGQANFVNLKTLTGLVNDSVNISTYDEIQIVCTVFDPQVNVIKVIASSFNEAGGSAIDIDVSSGDNLTEVDLLTFTSSDNSVMITGDNLTKSVDLKVSPLFGGAYVDSFSAVEWVGPVSGSYSLSYPQALHLKGSNPTIVVCEFAASIYTPLDVPTEIDLFGNIILKVPQTPDLRFTGIVIIN
jgi:hypothetical protein